MVSLARGPSDATFAEAADARKGTIRVLVAARMPAMRAGLEALVSRSAYAVVVGTTSTPDAIDVAIEHHEPDVVLVGIGDGDAIPSPPPTTPDAAQRTPALVLLAPRRGRALVEAALHAGARGALPTDATPGEIEAAIVAAAHGLMVFPAELATSVLPVMDRRLPRGDGSPLTSREIEILELLADGFANKVVAGRLGISHSTVKTHVASILEKLGAGTRAEAVALAVRRGVLTL